MSDQVLESLKRGAIEGMIAAGVAFFAVIQTTTGDLQVSLYSAGAAFFGALALRAAEGQFDANRQARGDRIPGDVTSVPQG